MVWTRQGTVAVTNGSATVTGTNAQFYTNALTGDTFIGPDGRPYEIVNIPTENALALATPYMGPTASGQGYAIMPAEGHVRDSAVLLRSYVQQFGQKMAALGAVSSEDIVPVAKGGTGATGTVAALANLGAQPKSNSLTAMSFQNFAADQFPYFTSPTAVGLAALTPFGRNLIAQADAGAARTALGMGASSAVSLGAVELFGAAPYIDFHYGNGQTDYDVRLINQVSGTLTVVGALDVSSRISSAGTWCRTGFAGSRGGTVYNFNWTGSNIDCYIDNTYVGTMTLFGSDYRFKKYIKNADVPSYLDRIDAYRIVNYQRKVFGEVFKGDGTVYQGLIAHEAQEVNPRAVTGEKDGVDAEGNPRVQQLDPMALITDLMGAVKELRAELSALKASSPTVSGEAV